MSRHVVIAGAIRWPWMGVKGFPADTDATVDALLEASRQPRGLFLSLYRAGAWPERLAKGKAS